MPDIARWDDARYQRLESVTYQDGLVQVRFADGESVAVDADRLLPERARGQTDWATLTMDPDDPYEFIVQSLSGPVEIPAYRVRLLTDPEFDRHWESVANRETPSLGTRFRLLRLKKRWQSNDLAREAGITPRTMSRFELGQHDLGATKLERLLGLLGCSWKDLDLTGDQTPDGSREA